MIKKTISYDNFLNEKVSKDFYFNWTVDEVADWQLSTEGGVEKWIDDIVNARSSENIMAVFRKIVGTSIGEPSNDGEDFLKSKAIRKRFVTSNAYSQMLVEFLENPDHFSEFISGLLPAGVEKLAEKNREEEAKALAEGRVVYTNDQLLAMTDEEFFAAAGTKKSQKMAPQFKTVAYVRRANKRSESVQVEKVAA